MNELERNKRFLLLLNKLKAEQDYASIELIATMIKDETPSMKRSFKVATHEIEDKLNLPSG